MHGSPVYSDDHRGPAYRKHSRKPSPKQCPHDELVSVGPEEPGTNVCLACNTYFYTYCCYCRQQYLIPMNSYECDSCKEYSQEQRYHDELDALIDAVMDCSENDNII